MAVYDKLLLSTGGGIISTKQQAKQVENTASILIGLGGTGIDCIKTIKAAVRERLEPDDPNAVVAEYSHIQFLGVDTDKKSFQSKNNGRDVMTARDLKVLDDTEIFDISNPNIAQALKNPRAIEMRPELKWLNYEEIDVPDLTDAGAGGFRQIGRYMFMDKSSQFLDEVSQMISRAKSGLTNPDVNIHIFAGLSGGTGSGSFLDACYLVKEAAAQSGGATVYGYFFLPDVNLSKIAPENRLVRSYVPCNGYAAMQELDYCMRISENGGSFIQTYKGGKQIKWEEPPVTMCHLICATDTNNNVIPNAYNYAMNVTSEYVLDFLTQPMDVNNFSLKSHLSNFRAQVAAGGQNSLIGATLDYCILGASCASIPLREINTYLASKLFAKFGEIREHFPSEANVKKLAQDAGLGDYDMLKRELSEGAGDDYAQFPGTWKEVRDYGDSDLVTHYTNQTSNKKGKIEENAKSMLDEKNTHSLIGRIRDRLVPYIKDIEYGPMFAYRMLEAAQSHNLLNVIDGLLTTNTSRWDQERAQERYREYEEARDDWRRKSKPKYFNEYEWRIEQLEKQKRELTVYEQLDKILKNLRKQIESVTAGYYLILQRVTGNLLDTFQENANALDTGKGILKTNDFAEPLMTIDEVRPKLDEALEPISAAGMMDQLMGVMLEHSSEWVQEDENKISKLVIEFFVNNAFSQFANRSITSFLSDKYNTTNNEIITNNLYNEYIKKLAEKAKPLFAFNPSVWDNALTGNIAFISIPASAAPVVNAANKLHGINPIFSVKESALTDRIYLMYSSCALPLGSYSKCREYELGYFASMQAGRHYYEGKPGGFYSDWKKLPSLTPESHIDYSVIPVPLKKQLEETLSLYETARKTNLIQGDQICSFSAESKAALTAALEQAESAASKAKVDPQKAKLILTRAAQTLQGAISQLTAAPTGYVLPHGSQADEETIERIRKDYFVISPAFQEMMKEDIASVDHANGVFKELKDTIDRAGQGDKVIEDFCHALFAGIFEFKPLQIIYHKQEFGIPTDVIMSKLGAEYPFAKVPLYQALVTYKAMDKDEQAQIAADADNLINEGSDQMVEAMSNLAGRLTPQYNATMAQNASTFAEADEIVSFLKKLNQEFVGLKGMLGL